MDSSVSNVVSQEQSEGGSSTFYCSLCDIYPSTLANDIPGNSGTPLCAECYCELDSDYKRKRAKTRWSNAAESNWVMKLKCEICSDNFDYNPVTGDDKGRFCSELCIDRYYGSLAEEPDEDKYDDYESERSGDVFEDIPKPSDFAPGKVYEEGNLYNGFHSCVVVKKDGTLRERDGPFTDRTRDGHTIFQTWEEWREYCRWHMRIADE
jgi:hypothetical protein